MKKQQQKRPAIIGFFDGCCEPKNPGGNMGVGACFRVGDQEIFQHSQFFPSNYDNSNNVAEYKAFEALLDYLQANDYRDQTIQIFGDSKLVIEQMNGFWRIKFGRYTPYADRCKSKLKGLKENNKLSFVLRWIPREQNHYADKLSKKQLIERNIQFKIQPVTHEDQL